MKAFRIYQRKEFSLDVYSVKTETVSETISDQKQAVKQHIERMNVTAENEYRRELNSKFREQQRHSKLIAKQSTEERILQQFNSKGRQKEFKAADTPKMCLENNFELSKPEVVEPEPVYAVVDLRNKYIQRKKRLMALQGKRWNSYESIFPTVEEQKEQIDEQPYEAIYEDGDAYHFEQFDDTATFQIPSKTEEENIYEPINVIEPKTSALTLRKYISRLTLNPFLRLHKTNKSSDCKDSRLSANLDSNNSAKKSSKFSTMRSKLGVHRKSVQRRIRRIYGSNYEPNPLFQYHNEETSLCGKGATRGKISPASKPADFPNINPANFEPTARLCEQQNEKPKTFDSLPHFKRAVARISLFNNSPFKGSATKNTQDEITNQRKLSLSLID